MYWIYTTTTSLLNKLLTKIYTKQKEKQMIKKIIFAVTFLISFLGFSQQEIDLTLKYNSSLNRYEVYARPSFTQNNFTWGPSQISIVTPSNLADSPLTILSNQAGNWGDNSVIYSPSAQPQNDFHGVESGGALINLTSGVETLIFSFVLPDGCVSGLRLFNNGIDPDSSQAGMFGGDFSNTIDNGMITDVFNTTYNNNGSSCIDAIDDTPNTIIGSSGSTNVINVFDNDILNGSPVNLVDVILTELNPNPTDPLTLNPDGSVDVAPNTPAGTYTLTYQICEVGNNLNCDSAIVTVVVEAAEIIANDDNASATPFNGASGQNNVINIYTNDTLNGNSFVPSEIIYTTLTPFSNSNITVDSNGNVSIAPNTPAGTYTSTYQICEVLNPTNCDDAIITIVVEGSDIVANDDTPSNPINGTDGGVNVINVLDNDTLNGSPVDPADVILTELNPNPTDPLTLNTDGSVDVAPNTPAGTYTLTYQICEVLNPSNCDDAIVTIVVEAAEIIANDDDASTNPINGASGQNNVINIYTNDTLNGNSFVPSEIIYTTLTPFSNSNITVDSNGNVSIAPNTPAGTYTSTYQICEVLNPTNCDDAIITIVVEGSDIVANDDTPSNPINGTDGGTNVINVLDNDTLNGSPVNPADVILTELNPNPTDPLTLNPDGSVDVAPNTPAGTYILTYQICEVLNPTNCDDATVTVIVELKSFFVKVMLQGSLFGTSNGIMRDDLRLNNVIPLTEPYTELGNTGNIRFTRPDFISSEQTNAAILSVTGDNAIVDWVFVELRDPLDNTIVLHTKAALVQKDGDVVESFDGVSPLRFTGINRTSYYVAIKHRNHIGSMSNTPVTFNGNDITFDFTTSTPVSLWNENATFEGAEQVQDISGKYALWAGNTNSDRKVKYSGTLNDQSLIFNTVINHIANSFNNYNFDFVLPVYSNGDVNMDAKVKYRGVLNDSNYVFFNVITKYLLNASDLYNYDLFKEQIPN